MKAESANWSQAAAVAAASNGTTRASDRLKLFSEPQVQAFVEWIQEEEEDDDDDEDDEDE